MRLLVMSLSMIFVAVLILLIAVSAFNIPDGVALEDLLDRAPVAVGASAVVVGNDSGPALAVPCVPGPRQVADLEPVIRVLALREEPLRKCVHKAALAIVLSELSDNKRHLLCNREKLALPAGGIVARVEIVNMHRGCQLIERIVDSIVKPLGQVV
jgi:hypothetical protein